MATVDAPRELVEVVEADGRYALDAFEFLFAGLNHTVRRVHGTRSGSGPQHVSGGDLCEGLREVALQRWGPLARTVLGRWGLRSTRDFGEMVFLLIEHGLMGKQDTDTIEDFQDVYAFDEAFRDYDLNLEGVEL